jgi:DNA-directed RNA polymerase subunit RPC12/RpoP
MNEVVCFDCGMEVDCFARHYDEEENEFYPLCSECWSRWLRIEEQGDDN